MGAEGKEKNSMISQSMFTDSLQGAVGKSSAGSKFESLQ